MSTTRPDPAVLDLEARAHSEHARELRLWLRLLACSQLIEKRVRAGLREHFDTTLPRFDLMAQLERHPEGLKMKELSHRLMVTGGNVTGITDQLVAEGLVRASGDPGLSAWLAGIELLLSVASPSPIRLRVRYRSRVYWACWVSVWSVCSDSSVGVLAERFEVI